MGAPYNFACKTCKMNYYLGYGSYRSWIVINVDSIKDYEDYGDDDRKELQININLENCLREHDGHEFIIWSDDWCHTYNNNLYSEGGYEPDILLVEGFSEYETIILDS